MEEIIVKILAQRLLEVDTYVLIILMLLYWIRKEYKDFVDTKKRKNSLYRVDDKLTVLTERFSNTFSKDVAKIVLKLIYSDSFSKLLSQIIKQYKDNRSLNDFRNSIIESLTIINDEQAQLMSNFKYSEKSFDKYIKHDIINVDEIMNDIENMDLKNWKDIESKFKTRMALCYNKTVEKL